MTSDLHGDGSATEGGTNETVGEQSWTSAERALLEAALEFYGAAEDVIEYQGRERPQLRPDAAGFEAVRQAMAVLEQRVWAAHAAKLPPQRIAQVARIEQEMVELILQRRGAAPSPAEG